MADPIHEKALTEQALRRVFEAANSYLAALDNLPAKERDADVAALQVDGRLPESGIGTEAAVNQLIESAPRLRVRKTHLGSCARETKMAASTIRPAAKAHARISAALRALMGFESTAQECHAPRAGGKVVHAGAAAAAISTRLRPLCLAV